MLYERTRKSKGIYDTGSKALENALWWNRGIISDEDIWFDIFWIYLRWSSSITTKTSILEDIVKKTEGKEERWYILKLESQKVKNLEDQPSFYCQ